MVINILLIVSTYSVRSQNGNRDHLTPQESDIVRDTQELDKRIDIFIKVAERRFAIMNGAPDPALKPGATKSKKKKRDDEEQDWGDAPKGTRAELLDDVAGILDEAITNIDDVNRKDDKNPLIGKALRKLAGPTRGFLDQLTALRSQTKNEDELSAIERAADLAQQIIDASAKAPAPVEDSTKKQKKP